MNKFTGWMILLILLECLVAFCVFMPTPGPHDLTYVMTFGGAMIGEPVLTEKHMQWFGMFVACPLVIWACYLLDHDDWS